jgi:hypothetical protein
MIKLEQRAERSSYEKYRFIQPEEIVGCAAAEGVQ